MNIDGLVYVIDDDVDMLSALGRLLRASGFRVMAFQSPEEFFAKTLEDSPACLLLEVEMPTLNGLQVQQKLKNLGVEIPIVFLTGRADIQMAVQAMQAGAVNFFCKAVRKEELVQTLRNAIARDKAARHHRATLAERSARLALLSPREKEVLNRVLEGWLNKQIAAEMKVDERSVKRHRASIMEKLQVPSLAALVQFCLTAGYPSQIPVGVVAPHPSQTSLQPSG